MSSKKVGITVGDFQKIMDDFEIIKLAKSIGADAIDYNLFTKAYDFRNPDSIYSKSDDEIIDHYTKVKKFADENGIEISQTHGRIDGFTNDEEQNDVDDKNARLDCLVTSVLGAPVCVMHGVTTFKMGIDEKPQRMRDLNFEMFNRFLVHAKKYNVQIATETFGDALRWDVCDFFGNIDEFIKTYNRIAAVGDNKKYFSVCVDTGHSNKAYRFEPNPSPANVIRMLGDKISVLHLHDNNKLKDQHKMPLSGDIDWNDVFDALDEIGFSGVYNMELNLQCYGEALRKETAEFAVKVLRNMLDTRYGA